MSDRLHVAQVQRANFEAGESDNVILVVGVLKGLNIELYQWVSHANITIYLAMDYLYKWTRKLFSSGHK